MHKACSILASKHLVCWSCGQLQYRIDGTVQLQQAVLLLQMQLQQAVLLLQMHSFGSLSRAKHTFSSCMFGLCVSAALFTVLQ
jgi:hypothetical protein